MLERFYWWIGMNVCARWWLRHCLMCQARKTPRLTVRWPIISMPLPDGPGVAISVDYFGPLPVTLRGNTYILLITDRFSRRADVFHVTAAEVTAEGTANVLVNKYIPLWGCQRTILSDNGPPPSFLKLYADYWGCTNWPQAPVIPMATVGWSG